MGLKPSELYEVSMYDFNMMAKAFSDNLQNDLDVMRKSAYLISVYSGLEGKERKKLTPEKMLRLPGDKKERKSQAEIDNIFRRSRKRQGVC